MAWQGENEEENKRHICAEDRKTVCKCNFRAHLPPYCSSKHLFIFLYNAYLHLNIFTLFFAFTNKQTKTRELKQRRVKEMEGKKDRLLVS